MEQDDPYSLEGYSWDEITTVSELEHVDLKGKRILFAISLGKSGINLTWYTMMKYFRLHQSSLEVAVGGVILDGNCEFYTKSAGIIMVFTTNRAGCTFPGRPLVEGTRTLHNEDVPMMCVIILARKAAVFTEDRSRRKYIRRSSTAMGWS